MYYIYSLSESEKSNLAYYESDPAVDYQLLLLTFNLTDNEFLHEINQLIINLIEARNFKNIEQDNLDSAIKAFFIELNWQLFSKFNKNEKNFEFGTSIFFSVIKNDTLYFSQFGRMLCGFLKNNHIEQIGKKWDNFLIKTVEDVALLGSKDEDIFVKVKELSLNENELFFSVPSFQTEDLKGDMDIYQIKREIRRLYRRQHFPYIILSRNEIEIKDETPWYIKCLRKLCRRGS